MGINVTLWGVRGSLHCGPSLVTLTETFADLLRDFADSGLPPSVYLKKAPLSEMLGFGSATSCVQVHASKEESLIIDAGSGLRYLSDAEMLNRPELAAGKGESHILMTHFHWDHTAGLPFFAPLFIPGNTIHFYSVDPLLEKRIQLIFSRPQFPVSFESLGAKMHFHILEPRREIQVAGFKIAPFQLDHPDPCWGYRVEKNGKVYAHCVDTEAKRVSRTELAKDLPLYQGVDLMFFDGQYREADFPAKKGWGHATPHRGLEIAMRERIKRVVFGHHEPANSFKEISALLAETQEQAQLLLKKFPEYGPVDWSFAFEGQTIEL